MMKAIKFNLILDGYSVRTLEGLREHFSIEDMLTYFRNGLLERWLEVRGYEAELEAIRDVDPDDDNKMIIKNFVGIFDIPIRYEDVEKAIAILDYLDEANYLNAEYKKNACDKKRIIDDYHAGYTALICNIEAHRDNMAHLKADAIEMEKEYLNLFILDHKDLYYRLSRTAPKAVFAFMTRNLFRKYWNDENAEQSIYYDIKRELLSENRLKQILGEDLRIAICDPQEEEWIRIENRGNKIMVLRIDDKLHIRDAGETQERWSCQDINGNFRIFDGLEYQCDDGFCEVLYMEV